ncbi:hypothetical protein R1sor_003580 [Riccia sorocarpa]|uniref:Uncharacterized protein n=1 Tax=Riccia sorocarpa TaxID=122646 RepID=A0ABD3H2D1_9MARC
MEVQPESATPTVEEEQPEPATVREEGRQRKQAKKQSDGLRVYEGFFRADQFFDIPNQFAVLKTSLKSTIDILHANKTRTKKIPSSDHRRTEEDVYCSHPNANGGLPLKKKQVSFAADCLYRDLPSGLNLDIDDNGPPLWNVYPVEDDLPKKLMTLGKSILDDRGCLIILHSGSLRSTQQIADALDAYCQVWSPVASFDIVNDVPQFQPSRAMKVFHSKVEVFCKWNADFQIPKSAGTPFDEENSGRDSAVIYNYNTIVPKKLDDLGMRKCTGFVQTLLENFTTTTRHMADVDFFEVAVGPGPLQAKGTAQKPPVQTKIGRYLSSPAQDFTMPVYAANYALELAKNTTPPSQSRDKGRRQRYFNIPYIDDQAREANNDTVSLSSDEDR